MVNKKDLVVVALATFCLTATLFMVKPTRSNLYTSNVYNPWADLNDNGAVDIYDAIIVANAFGASGDPINKTALLIEVNATYASLVSRIDSLNTSCARVEGLETQVATMNTTIFAMNATITQLMNSNAILNASVLECRSLIDELNATLTARMNTLESELASLNVTIAQKLGPPDYDSTWYNISKGESIILTHNLGTTDVIIYMIGNDTDSAHYIHQIGFGGDNYFSGAGGAYWYELTPTTIKTTRAANDNDWHQMRVLIWKVPR